MDIIYACGCKKECEYKEGTYRGPSHCKTHSSPAIHFLLAPVITSDNCILTLGLMED